MSESKEARRRRHFSDDQKSVIVRRHLADKVPVSDLADEYQIQPSMIYLWTKQVLDQAERAFQNASGKRGRQDGKDRQIAGLEARLARQEAKLALKNEVIAELLEENLLARKSAGEPETAPSGLASKR
ncbi:MAG: transposase [Pirellulaceae bacterium]